VKQIEQSPPARISKRLEYLVSIRDHVGHYATKRLHNANAVNVKVDRM
jgi:hypothetical protein